MRAWRVTSGVRLTENCFTTLIRRLSMGAESTICIGFIEIMNNALLQQGHMPNFWHFWHFRHTSGGFPALSVSSTIHIELLLKHFHADFVYPQKN